MILIRQPDHAVSFSGFYSRPERAGPLCGYGEARKRVGQAAACRGEGIEALTARLMVTLVPETADCRPAGEQSTNHGSTEQPSMNLETLKTKFWRDGYLVVDDFFAAELMDGADRQIQGHFGDDPEFRHEPAFLEKSRTEVIPWFPQNPDLSEYSAAAAAPFDRLEADPRLQALTGSLLGDGWRPLYSMVMYSKPGTAGQAWHQDCPPDDASRYNLNRLVYTRDLSDDGGGQVVVMPGSHRLGELPAGDPHEDLDSQIVLKPKRGSLVMLHGHTWHRVLPITGGFRSSTNFRACPRGTPADITDVCVYRNMRYRFSTARVIQDRGCPN